MNSSTISTFPHSLGGLTSQPYSKNSGLISVSNTNVRKRIKNKTDIFMNSTTISTPSHTASEA